MISYSLWEFRNLGQIKPSNPENGSHMVMIIQVFSDGNMSSDKNHKRSLWTHAETLASKLNAKLGELRWSGATIELVTEKLEYSRRSEFRCK